MKMKMLAYSLGVAGLLVPMVASATNGYFAPGYGTKNKGMAGVSTANTHDTFGGANNPAQMVWVGERLDVGLEWFRPIREANRVGSGGGTGAFDFNEESENNDYLIPEFGYNRMINPSLSLGVTVYGNGGMNTTYESGAAITRGGCVALGGFNPANPLCGIGALGVNLVQLIIAPTVAYKLNPQHSIGVSPLIGYQRFKAYGLQPFAQISTDPLNLTNKGTDDAWGWGVRVGYLGKLTDSVSIGAAYATKIYMSEFDKYKGLFAEQGDFDIPANLNLGIAVNVTPAVKLAFDYQRVWYSGVDAVGNSSVNPLCGLQLASGTPQVLASGCLGGSQGIGFGWQDVDVFKFGVEYKYSDSLTLRAGYSHGDNPIKPEDVTFNMLAPGVIEDHATIGFTYALDPSSEISAFYAHAFENEVSGTPNPLYFPVGGIETIRMHQDSLGIAWSKKW